MSAARATGAGAQLRSFHMFMSWVLHFLFLSEEGRKMLCNDRGLRVKAGAKMSDICKGGLPARVLMKINPPNSSIVTDTHSLLLRL